MKRRDVALFGLALWLSVGLGVGAQSDVDTAFARFWAAGSPEIAATVAADLTRSGVTFDDALKRLKQGRPYSADVKKGVVRLSRRAANVEFQYAVNVPDNYDPARRYPVRFQLHGGVGRTESQQRGDGGIGALAGSPDQIYILPTAWADAPWWGDAQVENLRAILDSVKRSYNVDENRVALAGVSDGATGLYYFAMRDPTPYASFLALNGFIMVLAEPSLGIPTDLFPNNLKNKPFFLVNGGLDPLYPLKIVSPYVTYLAESGVDLKFVPQLNGEHNTSWWPEVKGSFEEFVQGHPRDPLPSSLTWQSSGAAHDNRADWLVVDKLTADADGRKQPEDLNDYSREGAMGVPEPLFVRKHPWGRVDLVRSGNTVEAKTKNVADMTLLLSADAFDFNQPIKVVANGRTVFEGRVQKSVATLLKWAARDNDRTMLFAAELHVKIS